MHYRPNIHRIILLTLTCILVLQANGQQPTPQSGQVAFFDSIDRRIDYLEKQIARLKQYRDVAYLNFQRELDHTLFVRAFEEYVQEEDLEKAKTLVEAGIEKSEFRKDQTSVKFYYQYQENVYALIKQQRMHYQALFLKEKNFKKEFSTYIESGSMTSYQKAQRMVEMALKYAHENNLAETVQYLENYESYTQALIFDLESAYDLAELANNAKSFERVFLPMVTSDSLKSLKEAEKLLAHCKNYGKLSGSSLYGEYFKKQEMILTSAISDLLDREGRQKELARYTDQSVVAQYDTLNPCGVFKWHEQIVVIDEFLPTSSMENVKKGEAIILADKMLATYLEKNKLCRSITDLRFGYAFIIPYKSNTENTSFYYNRVSRKWQFIACYTLIVSESYTNQVSKFMPPLFFEDEMDVASR